MKEKKIPEICKECRSNTQIKIVFNGCEGVDEIEYYKCEFGIRKYLSENEPNYNNCLIECNLRLKGKYKEVRYIDSKYIKM